MLSEKYIEQTVTKYAKNKGITCIKCGDNGVPDKLFLSKKGSFFIEFKKKNGKISELQKYFIEKNKELIDIYIVDEVKQGKQIIDKYD